MIHKRCALAAALLLAVLGAVSAQGVDAKTVTPAWVMEKEFGKQDEERQKNAFNVFFIGYDFPALSGALATSLAKWDGPLNAAVGMESCERAGSSPLFGLELELMATLNDSGSRFLMNDMMMVGYSLDLAPLRLNAGARLGLCILDVADDADASGTYTALGGVIGPEASLYFALDKSTSLWARGRYAISYYFPISGNGSDPVSKGDNSLNLLSLEAGLAFKL
jgi:hypothetical protein